MYVPGRSGVDRRRFRMPASRRPTRMIASPPKAVFTAPYPKSPARRTSTAGSPSISPE